MSVSCGLPEDVTPAGTLTAVICVRRLSLDFGPIRRLDYDGDGDLDHMYVVRTALAMAGGSCLLLSSWYNFS